MMGKPMAARIVKAGYRLHVADADVARVETFVQAHGGVLLAEEGLAEADVLVTMLPSSDIVESVLFGPGHGAPLARALKSRATVIDMSSSEPARSKAVGARLAESGVDYLDAPVSGGVKRAVDGSLAILVGGEAGLLAKHRSLLETMGAAILHVGPAGAGHAAKALNNYVSAAGLLATVEALQIGNRFGIDPQLLTDVFNTSSAQTNTSLNKVKQFMLNGAFSSGFSLQLMAKDLGIAGGLAHAVGYPMTMGQACIDVWRDAAASANPATDHTEMYRLLS